MNALALYAFGPRRYVDDFPPLEQALHEPDGLLAAGGDLSAGRLLAAYRRGIFPWYSAGQPILWWSPDPRCVLWPGAIRISRSLRRTLRQGTFSVSHDRAFGAVIAGCAARRGAEEGTWIGPDMSAAYQHLHALGHAHSIEVWNGDELAGGLYGVAIGKIFFGESMFSRRTDASKVALVHLCDRLTDWGYRVIDCQVHSAHLGRLGATTLPRTEFAALLRWAAEFAHNDAWPAPAPVLGRADPCHLSHGVRP